MKFIALLICIAAGAHAGPEQASDANASRQEAAIKDSFDWAAGIIHGLGTLAPPPQAAQAPQAAAPAQQSPRRSRPKPKAEPEKAIPAVSADGFKNYEYEQKGRYTEVVIKIKDKIENGASKNFKITVTSTQPLTGWTIRVKGSDTVVASGGLFGESSFTKLVPEPFRPEFVMNLSVKRDGSDWVDFFRLYNEGMVQSR